MDIVYHTISKKNSNAFFRPGIGEKRSQAIIAGRPYKSIEELLTRKIIPSSVYADIKDKITL
jgi:DNA uptake protein ComE-like DNA-binding protein